MIARYRGFTIDACKERTVRGDLVISYRVTKDTDGHIIAEDASTDSHMPLNEFVKDELFALVNDYYDSTDYYRQGVEYDPYFEARPRRR